MAVDDDAEACSFQAVHRLADACWLIEAACLLRKLIKLTLLAHDGRYPDR